PMFVSRSHRKDVMTYEEITRDVLNEYQVIVTCTPLGMYPNTDTCPPLPYEALDEHHILYDLVYNPQETLFLQRGAAQGAQTKNGLEMLQLQADASWDFWEGEET
ncbi:MAG: shikimate dehydrogenase, partial [Prevotella sp.]|nr:shikimate dehydrogenase [Prevotella sp.]